jgi:hypothetical protein
MIGSNKNKTKIPASGPKAVPPARGRSVCDKDLNSFTSYAQANEVQSQCSQKTVFGEGQEVPNDCPINVTEAEMEDYLRHGVGYGHSLKDWIQTLRSEADHWSQPHS